MNVWPTRLSYSDMTAKAQAQPPSPTRLSPSQQSKRTKCSLQKGSASAASLSLFLSIPLLPHQLGIYVNSMSSSSSELLTDKPKETGQCLTGRREEVHQRYYSLNLGLFISGCGISDIHSGQERISTMHSSLVPRAVGAWVRG